MGKLPSKYWIFRVVSEVVDEPCETREEANNISRGLKKYTIFQEDYKRNYSDGKMIGISLLRKTQLKHWEVR